MILHKIIPTCIGLACICHGRRFRSSATSDSQRKLKAVDTSPDMQLVAPRRHNQSKAFPLLLLALGSPSAFHPSCPGVRLSRGDPTHLQSRSLLWERRSTPSHSTPAMSTRDESMLDHLRAMPLMKCAAQFLAACFVSCMLFLSTSQPLYADPPGGSTIAREVVQLVDQHYYDRTFKGVDLKKFSKELDKDGPLTEEKAVKKAEGLVGKLGNPGTRILSAEEWSWKNSKYDSTGVGLNLVLGDNGEIKVGTAPFADSDAARSGVKLGDVVTNINGKSTSGMTEFDALEATQNDGSSVAVQIKPANGGDARDLVLARQFSVENPVTYRLFDTNNGKVGYVKLSDFNAQSKRRVRDAVSNLEVQGANRLVLDLRFNRGGELDSAVGIAGLFADRPLVMKWSDVKGPNQQIYSREAVLSSFSKSVPMQVWVDQGSVSASEVLAGALRDNCRAVVSGGLTYGKGQIQGVWGLSNGGALVQTVATWKTPEGEDVDNKGIKPNLERKMLSSYFGEKVLGKDIEDTIFDNGYMTKACQEKIKQL